MKRIGILNVDALTEKMVRGLFGAVPDSSVFLFCASNPRAQKLSLDLPCWALDSYQDVIDEADVIVISGEVTSLHNIAGQIRLRSCQTLISLIPAISLQHLRDLFGHHDCVRVMLSFAAEINQSNVLLTAADNDVQHLLKSLGQLTLFTDESEFDLATVSGWMNGWFSLLAAESQCWFVERGLADDLARRLVLNVMKEFADYARYQDSARLGEMAKEIALSGPVTRQGLELFAQMQAAELWRTAADAVFLAIKEKTPP